MTVGAHLQEFAEIMRDTHPTDVAGLRRERRVHYGEFRSRFCCGMPETRDELRKGGKMAVLRRVPESQVVSVVRSGRKSAQV